MPLDSCRIQSRATRNHCQRLVPSGTLSARAYCWSFTFGAFGSRALFYNRISSRKHLIFRLNAITFMRLLAVVCFPGSFGRPPRVINPQNLQRFDMDVRTGMRQVEQSRTLVGLSCVSVRGGCGRRTPDHQETTRAGARMRRFPSRSPISYLPGIGVCSQESR